jgi:hypothetical protein
MLAAIDRFQMGKAGYAFSLELASAENLKLCFT